MLTHLLELRRRLLICFGITLSIFIVFLLYANTLTRYILLPLIHALPQNASLISIKVTAPMFVPLQAAFDLALLCTIPLYLFHLWRFVSPGLYLNERKIGGLMLCFSQGLFLAGGSFCFFVVLPWIFQFLMHTAPPGVQVMPDFGEAVNFSLQMLMVFGICFQLPVLCLLVVRLGWLTEASLLVGRPYAIVGAFIVGMLLTPPDVLSQILLAVPLCGLYELGILLVKWMPSEREAALD